MVIAELPLWVVHKSGTENGAHGEGTSVTAALDPDSVKKGLPSPNGGGGGGDHALSRAKHSLALLQQGGRSRGSKSAIYSIDCHPTEPIFCTGGGDGTVRLWNTNALFLGCADRGGKGHSFGTFRPQRPRMLATSDEMAGDSKTAGGKTAATPDHAYVSTSDSSIGDDNDDDDDEGDRSSSTYDDENPNVLSPVNDLTNVVRSKKHNQKGSGGPTPKSPAPTQKTAQTPSPSRGSSKQHHHHRLVATLSAHTGSSVLSVRFSNNGKYLASAGDDTAVCVYAKANVTAGPGFGDSGTEQAQWHRIKLCRGHGLDVVDLAWAPDDSHLVSCSLDSETPIIVWKLTDLVSGQSSRSSSGMICNPYKILGKGVHTSFVKGVTFDPAGSYLASSGDDPAVCIWRAHDDWGLEQRVDASSGIFRQWKEDESVSHSQSMFRRISWSTDGAFVVSTNSTVKNKQVASTISREGWSVSNPSRSTSSVSQGSAGAANLVGHKQPVVVSRHATQLLGTRKEGSNDRDDENTEPEYATLLALGDRRGFITVWSTRKSRPVFKVQCSENRCTITDLAWGKSPNSEDLILLVSMLDGQVVALRFAVPDELGGQLLSASEKARVFQLRYGIDADESGGYGRRLFVGDSSAPKFIESALQMTLENDDEDNDGQPPIDDDDDGPPQVNTLVGRSVRAQQQETTAQGKKRVRPVLMSMSPPEKRPKPTEAEVNAPGTDSSKRRKSLDPLQGAVEAAERASATLESVQGNNHGQKGVVAHQEIPGGKDTETSRSPTRPVPRTDSQPVLSFPATTTIPCSRDRIHTVDLPMREEADTGDFNQSRPVMTANCTNTRKVPQGSKGGPLPCIDLSLIEEGKVLWRDSLPGTSCTAISASSSFLAVGTSDGSIQLYGNSPSLGWKCGNSFRSHPALVVGHPVVNIRLNESGNTSEACSEVEMLVVLADGSFTVYGIMPALKLKYKGSLLPPMTHMALGCSPMVELNLPKLSRIQFLETGQLMMLLSLGSNSNRGVTLENAGGSVQAFLYDKPSELWIRASDSRFLLSDFHYGLPPKTLRRGPLSRLEDAVRMGSLNSSIKPSQLRRSHGGRDGESIYDHDNNIGSFVPTRSHCEDRMACALVLRSASEFKEWLGMYVKALSMAGDPTPIRMLVDMLLHTQEDDLADRMGCWLSSSSSILGLDAKDLVKTVVLPVLSKNRSLQRLTNSISLGLES